MLNKQSLFGTNDRYRRDTRTSLDATTPSPAAAAPAQPTAAVEQPAKVEAEVKAPAHEDSKGSKLIVGPDIKLKGAEITDCDTLVVEGRVEASMDSRVIQIAEQGAFHGTVGIDIAEIHGQFDGELTARKQLVIHSTGRVSGKIRYGKLVIEEGGELSGDVGTLKGSATAASSKPALAPTGTH